MGLLLFHAVAIERCAIADDEIILRAYTDAAVSATCREIAVRSSLRLVVIIQFDQRDCTSGISSDHNYCIDLFILTLTESVNIGIGAAAHRDRPVELQITAKQKNRTIGSNIQIIFGIQNNSVKVGDTLLFHDCSDIILHYYLAGLIDLHKRRCGCPFVIIGTGSPFSL